MEHGVPLQAAALRLLQVLEIDAEGFTMFGWRASSDVVRLASCDADQPEVASRHA
jgi:hypothetical protein